LSCRRRCDRRTAFWRDCRLAGRWSSIARAITNSDIIYRNARSVGFRRQSELTPEQLDTRRSIPHVRLSRSTVPP
jgi:hypothetical protein